MASVVPYLNLLGYFIQPLFRRKQQAIVRVTSLAWFEGSKCAEDVDCGQGFACVSPLLLD